ncbi:hypothetical protein C8R43DRAFT_113823 [Mycena crocata]|nr:hypothetical protein C8R43DRAFT_113823 [Mycena crocata]
MRVKHHRCASLPPKPSRSNADAGPVTDSLSQLRAFYENATRTSPFAEFLVGSNRVSLVGGSTGRTGPRVLLRQKYELPALDCSEYRGSGNAEGSCTEGPSRVPRLCAPHTGHRIHPAYVHRSTIPFTSLAFILICLIHLHLTPLPIPSSPYPEITGEVLSHYMDSPHIGCLPDYLMRGCGPLLLATVCRSWREICRWLPSLSGFRMSIQRIIPTLKTLPNFSSAGSPVPEVINIVFEYFLKRPTAGL